MSYTLSRIVTVSRDRLIESFDLTQSIINLVKTESYLVVTKGRTSHCLSIGRIVNFTKDLDLTKPVGVTLLPFINDRFVENYENPHIPVKNYYGFYSKRLVVFNPVSYKDYSVHFTSVNTPTIIDDVSRKGFLDDLVIISGSNQDMTHFLVAVNGVFHRTSYVGGKLYVLDGFRTIRLSGRKDVTVVDTKDIGGHTIIPLTKDNVTKSGYQQNSLVKLDRSIKDKTVLAVIDGYFYHRDQRVVKAVDNNRLVLHTNKMPLVQQFRHNPRTLYQVDRYGDNASQSSRKYQDAYEQMFLNKNSITTTTLNNADFQYSRLTAYHSFLVVLNNPGVFTISTDVIPTGTPQFYHDQSKRTISGMLNYGCGLCPGYLIWKDPHERKSIFLPKQDYDVDWQDQTLNPTFIPSLITDHQRGSEIPAKFIDYISS